MANDSNTVLITGGTGSLGQHLVRRLLAMPEWKEVRVFSRDEHKQQLMRQRFKEPRLRMVLGDIRDRQRVRQALRGCSHVLHLAAMKQVPACEAHPGEAVNTNVLGALHLGEAAIEAGVDQLLFISTDKAVSPVNLYGATKLVAEKILLAANHTPASHTRFAGIRFGNFFGSRGDVISLFRQQRSSGCLTLTDLRMTRFWMMLDDAAQFTLARLAENHHGGLCIPKMRSLKLTTLAHAIAPECQIREIGRRPGEKLHEWLISQDEAHLVRDMGSYFVLYDNEEQAQTKDGKPVGDDFQLRSDRADAWWHEADLTEVLADQVPSSRIAPE